MFKCFDISMLALGLPFDGHTLKSKSLGGSESAALYMAKAFGEGWGATVRLLQYLGADGG